jgi:hypothetical protein
MPNDCLPIFCATSLVFFTDIYPISFKAKQSDLDFIGSLVSMKMDVSCFGSWDDGIEEPLQ